jgi:hypothetical protein
MMDDWRMDWRRARTLRHDVERESATYRVVRLYQPPGSHYWELDVERRPTRERFVLAWEPDWEERLRRDAGY